MTKNIYQQVVFCFKRHLSAHMAWCHNGKHCPLTAKLSAGVFLCEICMLSLCSPFFSRYSELALLSMCMKKIKLKSSIHCAPLCRETFEQQSLREVKYDKIMSKEHNLHFSLHKTVY